MTAFATALDAELRKRVITPFLAVEMLLPTVNLRLLDGAATFSLLGNAYVGRHPTYGAIDTVEGINDGVDQSAPAIRISLLVPTNTAAAAIADPDAQGSQVSVYFGALNTQTGQPVSDPYLAFLGELDVATVQVGQNTRRVECEIVSALERCFDQDEGVRLNGPWHISVWPGEYGLEYVTAIQQQLPWGQDAPRPVMITDLRGNTAPAGSGQFRFPIFGGWFG